MTPVKCYAAEGDAHEVIDRTMGDTRKNLAFHASLHLCDGRHEGLLGAGAGPPAFHRLEKKFCKADFPDKSTTGSTSTSVFFTYDVS